MILYYLLTFLVGLIGYKVIERQSEFIYKKFPSPGRSLPIVGHVLILGRDKLHSVLTTWINKLGDIFCVHIFTRRYIVLANFEGIRQLVVGGKLTFKERYDSLDVNPDSKPAFITDFSAHFSKVVDDITKEIATNKGFAFNADAVISKAVLLALQDDVTAEHVASLVSFVDLLRRYDSTRWALCPTWLKLVWFPIYREQWRFERSTRALELNKAFRDSKHLHAACVLHNVFTTFISAMLHHTDLQKAIRLEVRELAKFNGSPTPDSKAAMPYTHSAVYEVLRLSAPTPLSITTVTVENTRIGDLPLPKGTNLLLNTLASHMDWNLWTEPAEFWPERFLDPDKKMTLPADDRSIVKLMSMLEVELQGSISTKDLYEALFMFGTSLVQRFLIEPDHTKPLPPINPMLRDSSAISVAPEFKFRMTKL